jgi:hypothetical protein
MRVAEYVSGRVAGWDKKGRAVITSDVSGRNLVCLTRARHLRVGDVVTFVAANMGEAFCVLTNDPRAPEPA